MMATHGGLVPYIRVPVPNPDTFNPHTSPVTYLFPDGSNMTFSLAQIDEFRVDQLATAAIFASQTSAAFIVLCVMMTITHSEKRKTAVFLINMVNLCLVLVRGILFIQYFTGPLARTYTTFAWDTDDVPASEKHTAIASSILSLLLMIGTQISLLLQVRICYTLNPRSKVAILATSGSLSIVAVTAYMALGIYIIQLQGDPPNKAIVLWAMPTVNALVAFSIAAYSGLFSWRMFQSARNRRKMGFAGFGSLESLLISGCQCLIFPAIFCIIENFVKFGGSASLAQASIALVLPVSHLWATQAQTNSKLTMARAGGKPDSSGSRKIWQDAAQILNFQTQKLSICLSAMLEGGRQRLSKKPSSASLQIGDLEKGYGMG